MNDLVQLGVKLKVFYSGQVKPILKVSQILKATRLILITLFFISSPAFAQITSTKIYFVPWDVTTRVALNAEGVITSAPVKTEILDSHLAESFLNWLSNLNLEKSDKSEVKDLRLVIIFEFSDGTKQSFLANRFDMLDVDTGKIVRLNESFRFRFASLTTGL